MQVGSVQIASWSRTLMYIFNRLNLSYNICCLNFSDLSKCYLLFLILFKTTSHHVISNNTVINYINIIPPLSEMEWSTRKFFLHVYFHVVNVNKLYNKKNLGLSDDSYSSIRTLSTFLVIYKGNIDDCTAFIYKKTGDT